MAQTTASVWIGAGKVEISTNGSSWTDISGQTNRVNVPTTERREGQAYTLEGEWPIVKTGKMSRAEMGLRIIYTEGASDTFETFRTQFEAAGGGTLYIRWSPKGGDAGEFQFTTGEGHVRSFTYPGADAEEDGPHMIELSMVFNTLTKSVVAT